jgi:hypothetical protein
MSEKKVVRRSVAIALGIVCIIVAVGLTGAFTILATMTNTKSPQNSQSALQSWTEGNFSFNLNASNNTSYTIPTGGFRSVTITIDAWSLTSTNAFQVFIGFITANATVDYQIYYANSGPLHPSMPIPINPPPWWYGSGIFSWPASFRQTYEVSFSEIMVWIWNNSTSAENPTISPSATALWGNVYYYLTA